MLVGTNPPSRFVDLPEVFRIGNRLEDSVDKPIL